MPPRGSAKKVMSDERLKELETMSGLRLPMHQIAAILGLHKRTLERYANKNKDVQAAIERGRAKASAHVIQTAFQMATSSRSPQMTIFWLKTQEKWRETSRLELTGPDGAPLESTKELTPEQRKAVIQKHLGFLQETGGLDDLLPPKPQEDEA